jgi:DNA replication and repair protein RecF
MAVAWLTPQMDQLFNEGGSARRRFLDRLVYGFDTEHAGRVNAYEYAMRERNRLLSDRRADPYWLDSLEHKMAQTGAAIAIARMSACDHINEEMQRAQHPFPRAILSIEGLVERKVREGATAVAAESAFASALHASRREDAAAGRTLSGAHRSELSVLHSQKNMEAATCSTGEQKALLLSIVLAEARACARWKGIVPVLLLDEVVAHLDAGRRQELFREILATGAQAWMTGTDAALFAGLEGSAQFLQVEQGTVEAMLELA